MSANGGIAFFWHSVGPGAKPGGTRDDARTGHRTESGSRRTTTERGLSWQPRSSRSRTASSSSRSRPEKPQEGRVVATGPGRIDDKGNRVPLDVAEGDVVIFSKYGGTEVKYDGSEYLLLNARDILAVVSR